MTDLCNEQYSIFVQIIGGGGAPPCPSYSYGPVTFVINTSRYGFIMLGSSDSKKKTLGHIYDTERLDDHRHVGHCVHARVVVYMYLIFVMT